VVTSLCLIGCVAVKDPKFPSLKKRGKGEIFPVTHFSNFSKIPLKFTFAKGRKGHGGLYVLNSNKVSY
jgi:hypothetical protein